MDFQELIYLSKTSKIIDLESEIVSFNKIIKSLISDEDSCTVEYDFTQINFSHLYSLFEKVYESTRKLRKASERTSFKIDINTGQYRISLVSKLLTSYSEIFINVLVENINKTNNIFEATIEDIQAREVFVDFTHYEENNKVNFKTMQRGL